MIYRLILLLTLLPLTACISVPKYVPIDDAAKSSLGEVNALSVIAQDEIVVTAQTPGLTQAAGGGLLVALIESQISKSRQEGIQTVIEPFYAAVDDVDFRKRYWTALQATLRDKYPLKLAEIKTSPLVMPYQERQKIPTTLAANKSLMYIVTAYTFTPDMRQLNIITSVDLMRGGREEPAYSNNFYYQSRPVSADKDAAIGAWANASGKAYREAVDEGISETMKMFLLDMLHPQLPSEKKQGAVTGKPVSLKRAGVPEQTVTGATLEERESRVIVRNSDGRLHSLPQSTVRPGE